MGLKLTHDRRCGIEPQTPRSRVQRLNRSATRTLHIFCTDRTIISIHSTLTSQAIYLVSAYTIKAQLPNYVERVAEWLRRWTRDLGVRGSIPAAPVMCKKPSARVYPHRLCLIKQWVPGGTKIWYDVNLKK